MDINTDLKWLYYLVASYKLITSKGVNAFRVFKPKPHTKNHWFFSWFKYDDVHGKNIYLFSYQGMHI